MYAVTSEHSIMNDFFFSSRRRHTRFKCDWSSDVCSSDLSTGIVVTGEVPDIRPMVHNSCVYVVPLRIGGGTRIKIFEAMAMGKAIVSTSVGAEGLPVRHNENIILADDPEDFAKQVARLLRDRETRERIGRAARILVEQNYSWRSVVGVFDTVFERVTAAETKAAPKLAAGMRHEERADLRR